MCIRDRFNNNDSEVFNKVKDFCMNLTLDIAKNVNSNHTDTSNWLIRASDSWYHITKDKGYHDCHTHSFSPWCGIFYVDKGDSDSESRNGINRFYNNNNFNIVASAHTGATGDKKAYMDFQGSHGMAKNGSDISLSGDVSYVCVCRIRNSTSSWRTLTRSYSADHHVIVQSGAWNIGMYDNNSAGFIGTGYSQQSLPGYGSNTFMVMIWRWSNSDNPTYELHVDGVSRGSISNSNARYNRGFGSIGGYHSGNTTPSSGSQYWGDIRMFAAWSRRISNQEVCDIVNAMRSRGYLQDP